MITDSFIAIFLGTLAATCLAFVVVLSLDGWQAWMMLSVFPAALTGSLLGTKFTSRKTPAEIILGTAFGFASPIVVSTFPAGYLFGTRFIPASFWVSLALEMYLIAVFALGIGLAIGFVSNAICKAELL